MGALTSFTNKDWISEASPLGPPANPATATKINAGALEDLETRLWNAVANESTSLQSYADNAAANAQAAAQQYADGPITTVTKSVDYSFAIGDVATLIELTGATARTFTIPTVATAGWVAGHWIEVAKMGTGDLSIVGAAGVTVRPTATVTITTQYAGARLRMSAANVWVVQT
jgi:hypothetical protein